MARNKVNFPSEFSHISNIKLDENSGDLLVALHEYKTQELHELKDELARAQIDDIGDWLYSFYGKFAGIDLTGNKTVKDYIDSSSSGIEGINQSIINLKNENSNISYSLNNLMLQMIDIQNNLLVINDVPDSTTNTNANDSTVPNDATVPNS